MKTPFSCLRLLAIAFLIPLALRATLPSTTTGAGGNLTVIYPAAAGTVTTGVTGSTLTVTSTAPITVLNWANFWDGTTNGGTSAPTDVVNFALPNVTASILNNVSAGGPDTTVNGSITSNGKVYLLNAAGIAIGATGAINAAGFYASTVPENLSYFESNGTLQVFTSTPPAQATTGVLTANGAATLATVGGSGDIRLAGNGVSLGGGTITGNVFIVDAGAATPAAVTLGATSALTVAGRLAITSNGGAVALGGLFGLNVGGSTTVNTTGTSNGAVTSGPGTLLTSGASIVTGTGSGTADGAITLGSLSLGLTGGVPNPITLTGGATSITDTSDGTLTLGTSTLSGSLTLSATGSIATQNFGDTAAVPAAVAVTAAGATISLTADSLHAGGKTIAFNATGPATFATLSAGGAADQASLTTTGNLVLGGAVAVPTLSLASTSGTISQTAPITSAALSAAAPTITLTDAGNAFASLVIAGGGAGAGITIADATGTLTIGNKTATAGNASITNSAGNITLGSVNADTLSFGGNLALALTGTGPSEILSTLAGTITVSGATTVTAAGAGSSATNNSIALGSATASPIQTYTFTGPITTTIAGTTGGNISLFANSGIILGATSTGGVAGTTPASLTVISALTTAGASGISNPTGVVTVTGNTVLAAGSAGNPTNLQIGGSGNAAVLAGNTSTVPNTGIVVNAANNLSLTNSLATVMLPGANPIPGLATLTQAGTGAASAITSTAALAKLSLVDTGAAPSGAVSVLIPSGTNVTLTNLAIKGTGPVTVTTANGTITLGGGIAETTTGTTRLVATGASADILDTVNSPVSIFGPVVFSSDGPINLSHNTANSLGGVSLVATEGAGANNNNLTYTEGGGVNLQGLSLPGTYTGVVGVTSVSSVILDTASSNLTLPATAKLTLTATSSGGAVQLNNPLAAADAIASPVTINASGNSEIWSTTPLVLNNVTVTNGTFGANTTRAGAGGAISQALGATIWSYGADAFTTHGSAITLTNSGNNFGGLTIDTTNAGAAPAGASATLKEFSGNNYVSVRTGTGGAFTATSEQSVLIETGSAGIVAGGQVTLAAPNGSIAATATGNNFNAANVAGGSLLVLTTTGNATVTDLGGATAEVTVLGSGTNVAGNLLLTNSSANGAIKDNGITGNVTVGGNAAFVVATSGTGEIAFTAPANSIPRVQLKAGAGATIFQSNTSIEVLPGTLVVGPATISASGNLTMTTTGTISFAGTLNLNAQSGTGNITLSNPSAIFDAKVTAVTAVATGDVRFSGLSLATNFNGVAPAVTTANNATYYQAPAP